MKLLQNQHRRLVDFGLNAFVVKVRASRLQCFTLPWITVHLSIWWMFSSVLNHAHLWKTKKRDCYKRWLMDRWLNKNILDMDGKHSRSYDKNREHSKSIFIVRNPLAKFALTLYYAGKWWPEPSRLKSIAIYAAGTPENYSYKRGIWSFAEKKNLTGVPCQQRKRMCICAQVHAQL